MTAPPAPAATFRPLFTPTPTGALRCAVCATTGARTATTPAPSGFGVDTTITCAGCASTQTTNTIFGTTTRPTPRPEQPHV